MIAEAHVALGAVAPTVAAGRSRRRGAGRRRSWTTTRSSALDAAARAACHPIDDKRGTIDYRTKIAGVLARRAATIAYARAEATA